MLVVSLTELNLGNHSSANFAFYLNELGTQMFCFGRSGLKMNFFLIEMVKKQKPKWYKEKSCDR